MMRGWNTNQWPVYGPMMWGNMNAKMGTWLWWTGLYHITVSVLILVILVLVAVLLWKKIEKMDEGRKR